MSDHPIISIVDDDQEVRESLEVLIDSIGLDAKSFSSGVYFDQLAGNINTNGKEK